MNQVNFLLAEPLCAISERKVRRVCDNSLDTVLGEEPLGKKDLRVEVSLLWFGVSNRNRSQWRVSFRAPPFRPEHFSYRNRKPLIRNWARILQQRTLPPL